jgi:TetR/AcrR family transcriptional regulator, cholesterol catabolism regulator
MSTRRNLVRPRESIFEVATQLFGEQGYAGTTMREIAKAVGVLPGSLYAHIDSKETLLVEIVEAGIDKFLDEVRPIAAASEGADERMRGAIKAHVRVVGENPDRTLVVFHQWRYLAGPNRSRIVAKRAAYQDLFARILREGMTSGVFNDALDPHIAVLGLLGALNWTPEWFSPEGPAGADEVGERLAGTLMRGLAAR